MTREKNFTIARSKGIDRRKKISNSPNDIVWDAKNLDLTPGGGYKIRDRYKLVASLNQYSIGLYTMGGKLRSAVPAGNSIEDTAPYNVVYDPISPTTSGAVSTSLYSDVTAVTSWGADNQNGPLPYLVVRKSNGQYEHHYCNGDYKTRITLPFVPGDDIVKLQNKLFAQSRTAGTVHFSSTVNGPTDWTAEQDAGFIDVVNQSAGDSRIQGLSFYNSQLAVFFPDSIQFWQVDPDPANFALLRTLNGPGTMFPDSVAPVVSDLYFYSLGGFRSLQAMNVLGELRQDPFGDKIQPLVQPYAVPTRTVKAFWSQARSQYLCFFTGPSDTVVFCYRHDALGGADGWTYWELDKPVHAVAELDETLYFRSGDDVYEFVAVEEGETVDFDWELATPMFDGGDPRRLKQWKYVEFECDGYIDDLKYRSNDADPTVSWQGGYNILGPTASGGAIPIMSLSHKLGLVMSGERYMLFDGLTLQYTELSGAG